MNNFTITSAIHLDKVLIFLFGFFWLFGFGGFFSSGGVLSGNASPSSITVAHNTNLTSKKCT